MRSLDQPRRGRRAWVLDLDPIGGAPGPVRLVPPLRDDAFQPHGAGVTQCGVAVAPFHVVR